MKRTLTTAIAVSLLIASTGLLAAARLQTQSTSTPAMDVLAQRGNGPGQMQPGQRGPRGAQGDRFIEELNLTDEQVSQLQAIKDANRDAMQDLGDRIATAHDTLRDMMAGDATEAELRAQHEIVQDLHQEAGDQKFETMLAIRAILTPEQRAEMADRMQQRHDRYQENMDFRGEHGQGRRNR